MTTKLITLHFTCEAGDIVAVLLTIAVIYLTFKIFHVVITGRWQQKDRPKTQDSIRVDFYTWVTRNLSYGLKKFVRNDLKSI